MQNTPKFDEICKKSCAEITYNQLKTVGKNIKKLRTERNITQNDLGYFIFSDKSLISALERGKQKNITFLTLIKLAEALKVKLEDLLNEKPSD